MPLLRCRVAKRRLHSCGDLLTVNPRKLKDKGFGFSGALRKANGLAKPVWWVDLPDLMTL